jgi:hypothetical protein
MAVIGVRALAGWPKAVRMIGTSGRRLRSRTPPAMRRGRAAGGGECCICLDDIGSDERWTCLRCNVVAHVRCMPTEHGHIHLPGGCPQCSVTMNQLVAEAEQPRPASKGIVCYECKHIIEEGTMCRTCPAPRHYCQAHWHIECSRHYGRRCPACNNHAYRALCIRRL